MQVKNLLIQSGLYKGLKGKSTIVPKNILQGLRILNPLSVTKIESD